MSSENLDHDKEVIRRMIVSGCDREMAAKAVGWTVPELSQVLRDDAEFVEALLRAEGQAEFHRMKLLHEVTKDEKHWRAATWWLERRAERRYSRRNARTVTTAEIQEFIALLVDMVFADITREFDRERLVTSLTALARSWEDDIQAVRAMIPVELIEPELTGEGQT